MTDRERVAELVRLAGEYAEQGLRPVGPHVPGRYFCTSCFGQTDDTRADDFHRESCIRTRVRALLDRPWGEGAEALALAVEDQGAG